MIHIGYTQRIQQRKKYTQRILIYKENKTEKKYIHRLNKTQRIYKENKTEKNISEDIHIGYTQRMKHIELVTALRTYMYVDK